MTDGELVETISNIVLGYREGKSGDLIAAIAGLKVKAGKHEASEQIDNILKKIDELTELKEDILFLAVD